MFVQIIVLIHRITVHNYVNLNLNIAVPLSVWHAVPPWPPSPERFESRNTASVHLKIQENYVHLRQHIGVASVITLYFCLNKPVRMSEADSPKKHTLMFSAPGGKKQMIHMTIHLTVSLHQGWAQFFHFSEFRKYNFFSNSNTGGGGGGE